ncbi:ethanolamine ammonia-lyase subunit EutC [uncultured Endozoicomonas sp.]|uniref:ethanolamine ammonia-lyase subunit EutC n=1 Tax=uncultured Endozoicomonas sp. TaxID=432652 RepID=UPI00260F477A|nr:ethanolamine ammonia-lyase subunit EutC [uncultured Endozoicomonas sp.]
MISENDLKDLIGKVLKEIDLSDAGKAEQVAQAVAGKVESASANSAAQIDDSELYDITAIEMSDFFAIENAENKAEYMKLKAKTPARLGIGRAGPRYKTETMLRFRADHAVAIDSVFNEVDEALVAEAGLIAVSSKCEDKDMYVTRPDLGRTINEEGAAKIQSECRKGADVQIVIADGLSSSAITANLKNILPALKQGLEGYGLSVGDTVFIKFGRVGAMDHLTELTSSKVTVMLVGERPGLATGESMGAYITYEGKVGMPEAGRTVVSNIHRRGTPAAEAGAHISNIVKKMFEQKCSGVGFRF